MVKITEISFLPTEPGCYLFRNTKGECLYVGKAKNLKKRVSSYFQKKDLDPKTQSLVSHIADIDIFTTNSEVEALLLENNLIKKYYPHYNIDLKDSHRYAYILLHKGELPWIEVARTREAEGEYYGPFVSGALRNIVIEVLRRNFRIFTRKPSPRLRKATDKETYLQRIAQARKILRGDVDDLIKELEEKMRISSQKTFYEHALNVRNQIEALYTLTEKQRIEMTRAVDAHIINYMIVSDEVYLLIFSIRKGVLEEKQEYSFEYYEGVLDDFLVQYYDQAPIPQEIILPAPVDESLADYLKKKSGRTVSLIVPQKGDKKDLLDLVAQNVTTTFFAGSERVKALQEILHLTKLPRYIECFDISHLSGTNVVASMVAFTNGLPDKSNYRKFKIRQDIQNDDYLSMKEAVRRRYSGSLKKSMKNPDLIVIDGGLGQLNAGIAVLEELKLKIPIIALAKKFEEIYVPGEESPRRVDHKNKGLQLLQAIRDEAHRFAISYQKLLRHKGLSR